MILGFDVQLQVALRALEEVVAPALEGAEKHVVEQLHLAMLTVNFVKTRLPDARRYARMELAGLAELGEKSAAAAAGADAVAEAAAAARVLLASPEADVDELEQCSRLLRSEVTALGSRCTDPQIRKVLDQLALDHGDMMTAQARQWCTPFGFELKPEELPAPAW